MSPRKRRHEKVPTIADRHRAMQALDLRVAGKTWQQIADELGYKEESAPRQAAERLVVSQEKRSVEFGREVLQRRAEGVIERLWERRADESVGRTILHAIDRLARLDGMFTDRVVTSTDDHDEFGGASEEELDQALEFLNRIRKRSKEPT
jgi:hypothetical protein